MITDVSKKILRDKIQLVKEEIDRETVIINDLDLRITEMMSQKQFHTDKRKKLQDDLKDMKSDTGDSV